MPRHEYAAARVVFTVMYIPGVFTAHDQLLPQIIQQCSRLFPVNAAVMMQTTAGFVYTHLTRKNEQHVDESEALIKRLKLLKMRSYSDLPLPPNLASPIDTIIFHYLFSNWV